jgi:short-subunit dehydrogenase
MAEFGFNICIVGRNKTKIVEKLYEIKQKYPKVSTKSVIFDFAELGTIKDYQEKIAE